jgi:hypothetical protein
MEPAGVTLFLEVEIVAPGRKVCETKTAGLIGDCAQILSIA